MNNNEEDLKKWIKNHKYYNQNDNYEDLFFTLLDFKEKKLDFNKEDEIINKLYKKISDMLISKLKLADFYDNYSTNNYGLYSYKKQIETIILCLDLIFEKLSTNFLNNNNCFYIFEKYNFHEILKKHKIKTESKNYIENKLLYYFSDKSMEYNRLSSLSRDWFIETINNIKKLSTNNSIEYIKNYKTVSLLYFCTYIELGGQPSKNESLKVFEMIWNNLKENKKEELSLFCEYFAKTNLFKNSIAPAKKLDKLITNFFGNFVVPIEDTKPSYIRMVSYEEKKSILYNHPAFLFTNLENNINKNLDKIKTDINNNTSFLEKPIKKNKI